VPCAEEIPGTAEDVAVAELFHERGKGRNAFLATLAETGGLSR
jgi:hypothetical protein